MRNLTFVSICLFAMGLTSCETTQSGYGYIAATFDEQAVMDLIVLSDQTINDRDYEVFKELFAPGFRSVDKSDKFAMNNLRLNRFDYLEFVRKILGEAKEIVVYSTVSDIEFVQPGRLAKVSIHEDVLIDFGGTRKRVVSAVEMEVGFEDGWIFFESATTIAKSDIEE